MLRWTGIVLAVFVVLVGTLTTLAILSFPSQAMARRLCAMAAERYGLRCRLHRIDLLLGPRLLEAVRLSNLTIFDPRADRILLQAKAIQLIPRLRLWGKGQWIDRLRIELERPVLYLRRSERGRWNLQELLEPFVASDTTPGFLPPPNRVVVTEGSIQWDGWDFSHVRAQAKLDTEGEIRFNGQGALRGTTITVTGETRLQQPIHGLTAQIRTEGLPLALFHLTGTIQGLLEIRFSPWPAVKGTALLTGVDLQWDQEKRIGNPTLEASFRLDPVAGMLEVTEASVADTGWRLKGLAKLQVLEKEYAYDFLLREARINLAELRHLFSPLPSISIQATHGEMHGSWPNRRPRFTASGRLRRDPTAGGPTGFQIRNLIGHWTLQGEGTELQGETSLQATLKAPWLPGEEPLQVKTSWEGNIGSRDIRVRSLQATGKSLGRVKASGRIEGWGEGEIRFETEAFHPGPTLTTSLVSGVHPDTQLEQIHGLRCLASQPSFSGALKLTCSVEELQMQVANQSLRVTSLEGTFRGKGIPPERWEAKSRIQAISAGWGEVQGVQVRLRGIGQTLEIHQLGFQAMGGKVEAQGRWVREEGAKNIHLNLSVQGVDLRKFLAIPAVAEILPARPPTKGDSPASPLTGSGALQVDEETITFRINGDLDPAGVASWIGVMTGDSSIQAARGEVMLQGALTQSPQGEWSASGTLRIKGLGLRSHQGSGPEVSGSIPLRYAGGTFDLTGGQVFMDAPGLLEMMRWYKGIPLQASAGHLTLRWDGTITVNGAVDLSGQATLEDIALGPYRPVSTPPLLTHLTGEIPFQLTQGILRIPRTTLKSEAELQFTFDGLLDREQGIRLNLELPRTPVSRLTPLLGALLSSEIQGSGEVEGRTGFTGKGMRGEILLADLSLQSDGFTLGGVNGKIPLGPEGPTAGESLITWPDLSEETHRQAQEEMVSEPGGPANLTIGTMGYRGIEARDLILALIPGEGRIAIHPVTFTLFGGKGWGHGSLDFRSRAIRLAFLIDDLSLQGLLNQFPPIRGYLSGRVDGLLELSVPISDPIQAKGQGRFWAVKSPKEERSISQEMIERLGGPKARFFHIFTGKRRSYDTGTLAMRVNQGFLAFHELEISHRTLGIKDLEIRVVSPFNRIALDHLIDSIFEAMERGGGRSLN